MLTYANVILLVLFYPCSMCRSRDQRPTPRRWRHLCGFEETLPLRLKDGLHIVITGVNDVIIGVNDVIIGIYHVIMGVNETY